MLVCLFVAIIWTNNLYAQYGSAYKSLNIESDSEYRARKNYNKSSDENVERTYIRAVFEIRGTEQLAYAFYMDGTVYDYRNNTSGSYYVGASAGYKIDKIHIRWEHGGKQDGILNYQNRSDGKPKLSLYTSTGTKVYYPR